MRQHFRRRRGLLPSASLPAKELGQLDVKPQAGSSVSWAWMATIPTWRHAGMVLVNSSVTGWKLHLVRRQNGKSGKSLCGIEAKNGWGFDGFLTDKCSRCASKAEKEGLR